MLARDPNDTRAQISPRASSSRAAELSSAPRRRLRPRAAALACAPAPPLSPPSAPSSSHPAAPAAPAAPVLPPATSMHELLECPVCTNSMFPPIHQHSKQGSVPSAVMLSCSWTGFWGHLAHLRNWRISGDTPFARFSAGSHCFLAIRQRSSSGSIVLRGRASFSSQHNQIIAGTIMADRELVDKDKLVLRGLQFHGFHGVKQEEKTLGQKFVVDVDAWMDLSAAGETDSISNTVSYTDIYRIVKDVVEGPSHNLLESVAHCIARAALLKFSQISAVRVKVGKPHVAVQGIVDYLGVEILRYRKDMGEFFRSSDEIVSY